MNRPCSVLALLGVVLCLAACSDDADQASTDVPTDRQFAQSQALPPVPSGGVDRDRYRDLRRALRDIPKRELQYPDDDRGPRFDSDELAVEAIVDAIADDDIQLAEKILAIAPIDSRLEIVGDLTRRMLAAEDGDDYTTAYGLRRYLHFETNDMWKLDTSVIRGHVYQAGSGVPVADVLIKTNLASSGEARSAADGSYTLTVRNFPHLRLIAEHPDHEPIVLLEVAPGQPIKVVPRGELVVDIALQANSEEAPGPTTIVRGQMIDKDSQQPISDMEVSVVPTGPGGLQVLMGGFTAMTDSEGRFEIADLPVGTHLLVARKVSPIYHHTDEQFAVVENGAVRRIEAQQLKGKTLKIPLLVDGYVHDSSSGKPVVNARVSGGRYNTTRTDKEGWFKLELDTGKEWHIQASHEWYHDSVTQTFSAPKVKHFKTEFVLDPITTGTIIGVAIDAKTGLPITRATINIAGQSVTTDSQGRFRLEEVESGNVSINAGSNGYRSDAQTIALEALKTAEAQLVLEPVTQGSISGTVVNAATGQPLSDVRVSALGQQAETDAEGQFLIEDVEQGNVEVAATRAVYERAVMSIDVVAQEVSELRIALVPITYGTLRGTVVDGATGEPLVDATVSLPSTNIQTDSAGQFVLEKVPAGTVAATASYPRFFDATQKTVLEPAGEVTVALRLQPITTGTVRGVVTNAHSGGPLENVSISIGRQTATTDATGQYLIEKVPAGNIEVGARVTLFEESGADAVLPAAEEISVNLQLIPITYGAISGTVTNATTRKAVAGARVNIGEQTAVSGSNGEFLFKRIPAGSVAVATSKAIFRDDSTHIELAAGGARELLIELVPITTGTLYGVVRDKESGRPLPASKISIGSLTTTTDNNGSYRMENAPAGALQLGAELSLYEPGSEDIRLEPASEMQLDIELVPITYGTILGTVVDVSSGRPIAGAKVVVPGKQTATDGDGRYELQHVDAGSVGLSVTRPIYVEQSLQRELVAGDTLAVDIALQPITWGSLSGRVLDAETGQAIPSATVSVAGQTLSTDRQGRFSIDKVNAGSLSVSAQIPAYKSGTVVLELTADDSVSGTIRLEPIKIGTIRGKVIDAKTGDAVHGARVSAGNRSAETDSSGSFVLEGVAIGRVLVGARHADYANGGAPAELVGGATVDVVIKLDLRREDVTNLEAALVSEGTIDLYGIRFDSAKDQFKPSSLATLRAVLEVMKRAPQRRFELAGHTDSDGADAANQNLSERRAQTVIAWLVTNGIEESRLDATGYGEARPAAPNDTVSGKALNRRVQLSFSR